MEIILITNLYTCLYIGLFNDSSIEYSAIDNRIRCMGHIINLSAQSFLLVYWADAIEESDSGSDSPITLAIWRSIGS
jgi:hypothetical protein